MIPPSPPAAQQDTATDRAAVRNHLLRDGVTFLALSTVAVILFAGTSLLFRSFTSRRDELARQFAEQGKQALQQHQPAAAIDDLRASLEYGPDDRTSRLLLAQALAEDGRTAEAMNYFAALRETEPADGFVNLQLARLYRKAANTDRAVDSYRSATLGLWDGDGIARRLQVQLEFSDYLIELGRPGPARAELLAAAGNAPESSSIFLRLGDEFQKANDPQDALSSYQKAVHLDPADVTALSKAGRQAYDMGDYAEAHHLLQLALKKQPDTLAAHELTTLSDNAERLRELSLSRALPAEERENHLRTASEIARHRLTACVADTSKNPAAAAPAQIQALLARWKQETLPVHRDGLSEAATQDRMTQLIFDTETQTAKLCGAPSGDDALLLLLTRTESPDPQETPE